VDADANADQLLLGLNEAQEAAVSSPARVLRIIAGAGSGKTRVLTHRIAYRVLREEIDPRRVLAVTFTRKAAAELRARLRRLGLPAPVTAGTFHSIAYAQLRHRWLERGVTPPELLDRKVGFVARLVPGRPGSTVPLDVTAEIEWAKARRLTPSEYPEAAAAAGRRPPLEVTVVGEVFARYEAEKRARRLVDFDDLLRLAARDLRADPDYAAARRWQMRHLFVDEFQDVNPLQFELLSQWHGTNQPTDGDLCVVGDPNQAIYGWNGADPTLLDNLDRHFPDCETIVLADNYRSSPQVLGVANVVLSNPLGPGRPPAHPVQLRPHRPDGPAPTVTACADEVAEARLIARRIRDTHAPGRPWSEHGVLVRTNAQLAVLEEVLSAAGIPTRTRGAGRLLDQPEVREVLRTLERGSGILAERLDELQTRLDDRDGEDRADLLDEERAANLAEVVRLGREYLAIDPAGTGAGFGQWVRATLRSDDGNRSTDAVDLTTFHAAKGLEWPMVHLAGLEEGLVPVHGATGEAALAEERRLLYVALTRAQSTLHCTWAERRRFGDRTLARRPSPHLEAIELALEMMRSGERAVDLREAIAAQRAELGARGSRRPAPEGDQPLDDLGRRLVERLREWRLAQARASAVPAYVIFNDATLAAIARSRPGSISELRELPGIGPVKAERFGAQVLQIVASLTDPSAPRGRRAAHGTSRGQKR
jgi:DNA helicase-2/ATP-dependent DNA helicase PcrA